TAHQITGLLPKGAVLSYYVTQQVNFDLGYGGTYRQLIVQSTSVPLQLTDYSSCQVILDTPKLQGWVTVQDYGGGHTVLSVDDSTDTTGTDNIVMTAHQITGLLS